MDFSIFLSVKDSKPTRSGDINFEQLSAIFYRHLRCKDKTDAPMFSPYRLEKGNSCRAEHVAQISMLVLDVDDFDLASYDTAFDHYRHIVHTTFSHSATNPRYRVILPLEKPILASEYSAFKAAWPRIIESLGLPIKTNRQGGVDSKCTDISRRYWLPSMPSNLSADEIRLHTIKVHRADALFSACVHNAHITSSVLGASPDFNTNLILSNFSNHAHFNANASVDLPETSQSPEKETYQSELSTTTSLITGNGIELNQPIYKGARHGDLLKVAVKILTASPPELSETDFYKQIEEYDLTYCKPPMQTDSAEDKRDLRRIIADVWGKYQHMRAPETTVNKAIMASPQVVDTIEQGIDSLNERYAYVEAERRLWRFAHNDFITWQEFLAETANYNVDIQLKKTIKTINLGKAWKESERRRTHNRVVYSPGAESIVDNSINLWSGWGANRTRLSDTNCEQVFGENIALLKQFVNYLFKLDPETGEGAEDHKKARDWFVKWAAYPMQHPGTKLFTAVLLWGRHGSGKTLLGQILGACYGSNFTLVQASMLNGAFNAWQKNIQFACGDEISTSQNKRSQNDALKHLITGDTISINEKYQPILQIKNCCNFIFTSNHSDAMALEQTERRFFVWHVPSDPLTSLMKRVARNLLQTQNGINAVMQYLLYQVDTSDFDPVDAAPYSKDTDMMVDAVRTDLEEFLVDIKEHGIDGVTLKSEVLSVSDIKMAYKLMEGGVATYPAIIRGLNRIGIDTNIAAYRREFKIHSKTAGSKRRTVRLISLTNIEHWATQDMDAWRAEYDKQEI